MKTLKSYHNNAAEYYLSLDDDDPEHILEAAYHFNKAGKKEVSAEVIINNTDTFFSKGFWNKIEVQLQDAIKAFQRKTQPQDIQLIARAHNEIGTLYKKKGDYDLALQHVRKASMLFKKIDDKLGVFGSYTLLFGIYMKKKEIEKAKEYNDKCLKIAESQNNDELKTVAMANSGLLLGDDDKDKKLDHYISTLKIFENMGDIINVATSYSNISDIYVEMENYKKAYEYAKKALELEKERGALYEIARIKFTMAQITYLNPNKSVDNNSIIGCLNEAVINVYEKIGHIRGTAEVIDFIGNIWYDDENFESALTNFQKVARMYSSLNQQSEEAKLNSRIAICCVKLKDFSDAKSYFEKNIMSGHSSIVDKLSLVEVYLNLGNNNEAFDLSKEVTATVEKGLKRERHLALLFLSVSSILLNKVNCAHEHLHKIVKDSHEENINWDFSDIEPVLNKIGESKQLYIDTISLLKSETNYPVIRLEDVKIINEEVGKQAEVFHPFTGSLTITKDDGDLKEIMQELRQETEIDFDTPEIMGILRDKALVILGFLFKKGFLDYKNIDKQKFDLKLTERGVKILNLSSNL